MAAMQALVVNFACLPLPEWQIGVKLEVSLLNTAFF